MRSIKKLGKAQRGFGTGDRSASLQHDEMEGAAFLFAWAGAVPRAEESLLCATSAPALSLFLCVQEL